MSEQGQKSNTTPKQATTQELEPWIRQAIILKERYDKGKIKERSYFHQLRQILS